MAQAKKEAINNRTPKGTSTTLAQEFRIRAPKIPGKSYHFMRFNGTHSVDFIKWANVKLERENNLKEFKSNDEEMPKFGAGSEYNREQREELRRKKYGIKVAKYNPDAQPWMLKIGTGKNAKKFKGIREGGVGENSAFYVFTHSPDGGIDAYPLKEWYNFQPIQRYKTLTAEEAEAEFGKQSAKQNFWSVMLRKRLRNNEEEDPDVEETATASGSRTKGKELKISEMDEWIDSDEDSDSEEDGEKKKVADSDEEGNKKGKNTKKKVPPKKKKSEDDSEAFEESDDGDNEGLEMDYDTSSSDDDSDLESKQVRELKGVAEEAALRKLLTSDDEEDEDNRDKQEDSNDGEPDLENKEDKKNKAVVKDDKNGSSSDFSLGSSDSEVEEVKKKQTKESLKGNTENMSRPTTPISEVGKRKFNVQTSEISSSDNSNSISTPAKRFKEDISASLPTTFTGIVNTGARHDDFGITEEAVRRYLKRKPITAKDLLTKFKNKKPGVTSSQLVETMTKILKKIDPQKRKIGDLLYLSLK